MFRKKIAVMLIVVLCLCVNITTYAHDIVDANPYTEKILVRRFGSDTSVYIQGDADGYGFTIILESMRTDAGIQLEQGSDTVAEAGNGAVGESAYHVGSNSFSGRIAYVSYSSDSSTGWSCDFKVNCGYTRCWDFDHEYLIPKDTDYTVTMTNLRTGYSVEPNYRNGSWRDNYLGTSWKTGDKVYVVGLAGNTYGADIYVNYAKFSSSLDTDGPAITATKATRWAKSADITITATDPSGVKQVLVGGSPVTGSPMVKTVNKNGSYTIDATDMLGNASSTSVTITCIDAINPKVSINIK